MFKRYTEKVRKVIMMAQEEAVNLNHNYIGTEHILVGLVKENEGLAGRILRELGVEPEKTIEEIEKHVSAGKPAMIYFSLKPVVLDTVDTSQYSRVKKFKEKYKDLGLIGEFENSDQFRLKLNKDIQICLRVWMSSLVQILLFQ